MRELQRNKLTEIVSSRINNPKDVESIVSAVTSRWFPRVTEAALDFLQNQLEDQVFEKFIFWGRGTHTFAILKGLRNRGIDCQCFIIRDKIDYENSVIASWNADVLNDDAYGIVLSHNEYEESMHRYLVSKGIANNRLIRVYTNPVYKSYISNIFYVPYKPNATKDVAFIISVRPTYIVSDAVLSSVLSNYQVCYIKMFRNNVRHHLDDSEYIDIQQSIAILVMELEKKKPKLVYVRDQFTTGNVIALFIKLMFPKIKVILEMYDVMRLFFSNPQVMKKYWYWDDMDYRCAFIAENEGFDIIDAVVHKEKCLAMEELTEKRNIGVLCYKPFMPLPHLEVQKKYDPNNVRLVWAGALIPSSLSPELFGDGQIINILKIISAQGLAVDLVTGHSSIHELDGVLQDYRELIEMNTGVDFQPGMERRELVETIAATYDYGLLLNNIENIKIRKSGFESTFSSKLLTYIYAGVPVIVSQELEYMANIVSKYQLGIVVRNDEILGLGQIVKESEYEMLKVNISKFRNDVGKVDIKTQVEIFIESVIDGVSKGVRVSYEL